MSPKIYINGRFLTQKITGVQRNAFELTKNILAIRRNVFVLVPNEELNKDYETLDWPIVIVGKFKGIKWEQIQLPLFLKNQKAKALLINLTNTAPLFYFNQVVSIMDMTTFIEPAWFNKRFAYYYQWLIPKIVKRSKMIFTISENSKQDIIRYTGTPSGKIKVLHCGISDVFLKPTQKPQEIIAKFGLKSRGYFMAVSSLDPRKNFKKLIESYFMAALDIPLVIVGSKGKAFREAGLAHFTSSKIIFTGYVSDIELKSLYSSCLCFVYPSLYEGFGIPPLEAMASGCPTIVSHTSSLPEVCGDASVYVNPHNEQSISSAMTEVLNNVKKRNELIVKGFENIKRFSWHASAVKAINEIETLL